MEVVANIRWSIYILKEKTQFYHDYKNGWNVYNFYLINKFAILESNEFWVIFSRAYTKMLWLVFKHPKHWEFN